MRIFLDTNVLASSVATRGLCSELLESVINEHELLTCEPVLQELRKVLAEKFRLHEPAIKAFLAFLRAEGELVAAHEPLALSFKDMTAFLQTHCPDWAEWATKSLRSRRL